MEHDTTSDTTTLHGTRLAGTKLRDGRYGPVFLGMRTPGEFVEVQVLQKPSGEAQHLLSQLQRRLECLGLPPDHPNLVSYLGCEETGTLDQIYLLTEWLPGDRLRELVRKTGPVPRPLAQAFLRQIVSGLEHLHERGLAPAGLDSAHVVVTGRGTVKLDAALLPAVDDMTTAPGLPGGPKEVSGQQDMRSADVWLLGMVAAEMLTGDSHIARDAGDNLASKIAGEQGSALEYLLPQAKVHKLDEAALDFLRQCLTM